MPMKFKRNWDFDQGNKDLLLNDLENDREVIEILAAHIAPAVVEALDVELDSRVAGHIEDEESDVSGALLTSFEQAVVLAGAGIDLSGTADSTAALRALFTAALSAGKRKFSAVPGATYKVQIDGSTHRNSLQWFTDVDNIQILGNGATLVDVTPNYGFDKLCNMFGFTRCENVEITGWNYIGPVVSDPQNNLARIGTAFVYAEDHCRNVTVQADLVNARYGVRSGDATQVPYGECSGFNINITGEMIGYPIAINLGYDVTGHIDVDGFHRASFLAGVIGATIVARFKNWYGATIANVVTNALTLYADDANYTNRRARGCSNIKVDATDTGSTVYPTQAMCTGLALSWVAQGTEFADIEMTHHVRSSNGIAATVGGFQLESVVRTVQVEYPFSWEPFITITGLHIKGSIDRTGQTEATNSLGEIFIRAYDSIDAGLTHCPVVSDVRISVNYKKGSVQTRPWFVEIPGLIDHVILDKTKAVGVSLTLAATTGTIRLRETSVAGIVATAAPHAVGSLILDSDSSSTGVATARITRLGTPQAALGFTTAKDITNMDAIATTGVATVTAAWPKTGMMVKAINLRVSWSGAPAGTIQLGVTGNPTLFGTYTLVNGVTRIMASAGLPYYPSANTNLLVTFVPVDGVTYPNGPLVQLAMYAERFSVDSL